MLHQDILIYIVEINFKIIVIAAESLISCAKPVLQEAAFYSYCIWKNFVCDIKKGMYYSLSNVFRNRSKHWLFQQCSISGYQGLFPNTKVADPEIAPTRCGMKPGFIFVCVERCVCKVIFFEWSKYKAAMMYWLKKYTGRKKCRKICWWCEWLKYK